MAKKNKINRRNFLKISGLGAVMLTAASESFSRSGKSKQKMLLYIGTYTNTGKSEGIYIHEFDHKTGKLMPLHIVKDVPEPSFLVVSQDRKFLFAVNELVEYEGKKSGAVSAFSIGADGNLTFLNKQPSLGGAPCHITVSDNNKFVLAANYVGGNVSVYPVEKDGKLGASVALVQHTGAGPNKQRQTAAHAHSITLSADNRFGFVGDLGIDKVMIYRFDDKTGKLAPNENQPFYQTKPGAGPRHFTFHPDGKFAFVINELDLTISSLAFDKTRGTLTEIQTVPTLPADASRVGASCADIHVSPDGKFLYGSNRGHNSIVCYRIDTKTGKLEYVEHTSTQGDKPRNFAIDPTGNFLLAANQNSDSVVVFRIDKKSGELQPSGISAQVPVPVCLKFMTVL